MKVSAINPMAVYFCWIEARLFLGHEVQTNDLVLQFDLQRQRASYALNLYAKKFPKQADRRSSGALAPARKVHLTLLGNVHPRTFLSVVERLLEVKDCGKED